MVIFTYNHLINNKERNKEMKFRVIISFMRSSKMCDFETTVEASSNEQAKLLGLKEARSFGWNGTVKKTIAKEYKVEYYAEQAM